MTLKDRFGGPPKYDIQGVLRNAFDISIPRTRYQYSYTRRLRASFDKELTKEKMDKFNGLDGKMSSEDSKIRQQGLVRTPNLLMEGKLRAIIHFDFNVFRSNSSSCLRMSWANQNSPSKC